MQFLPNLDKAVIHKFEECQSLFKSLGTDVFESTKGTPRNNVMRGVKHILEPLLPSWPEFTLPKSSIKACIKCKECRETIFETPSNHCEQKYKQLPCRSWIELVDCWSCHRSEFTPIVGRLQMDGDGDIWPKDNSIFYRDHYLLLGEAAVECRHIAGRKVSVSMVDLFIDGREHPSPPLLYLLLKELVTIVEAEGSNVFSVPMAGNNKMLTFKLISWQTFYYHTCADGHSTFKPLVIIEALSSGGEKEITFDGKEDPQEKGAQVLDWTNTQADVFVEATKQSKLDLGPRISAFCLP